MTCFDSLGGDAGIHDELVVAVGWRDNESD